MTTRRSFMKLVAAAAAAVALPIKMPAARGGAKGPPLGTPYPGPVRSLVVVRLEEALTDRGWYRGRTTSHGCDCPPHPPVESELPVLVLDLSESDFLPK